MFIEYVHSQIELYFIHDLIIAIIIIMILLTSPKIWLQPESILLMLI